MINVCISGEAGRQADQPQSAGAADSILPKPGACLALSAVTACVQRCGAHAGTHTLCWVMSHDSCVSARAVSVSLGCVGGRRRRRRAVARLDLPQVDRTTRARPVRTPYPPLCTAAPPRPARALPFPALQAPSCTPTTESTLPSTAPSLTRKRCSTVRALLLAVAHPHRPPSSVCAWRALLRRTGGGVHAAWFACVGGICRQVGR